MVEVEIHYRYVVIYQRQTHLGESKKSLTLPWERGRGRERGGISQEAKGTKGDADIQNVWIIQL